MNITVVPALGKQRELVGMPRNMERFQAYVDSMVRDEQIELPLFTFNPMSREHVGDVLDQLLAFDAESVAQDAVAAIAVDEPLNLVIVIGDDVRGGWTNRFITDYELRFTKKALTKRWICVTIWAGEGADERRLRREVLATVHRSLALRRNGVPTTLRDVLRQEGDAYRFAGGPERELDADDLAYTIEAIDPYLDATGRDVHIAVLYGDDAARECGYEALGFSRWAGLAAAYVLTDRLAV